MNIKKFSTDVLLNLFAAALPIILLQIIIFPLIGRKLDTEEYGFLLSLFSILNIIPGTIGTGLNNIRLLYNEIYNQKKIKGDFQILLISGLLINSIMMTIGYQIFSIDFRIIEYMSILFLSILVCTHDYLVVQFRLNLNYKSILIDKIALSIGYLLGFIGFLFLENWLIIFIIANLISTLYVVMKTDIWKDLFRKTDLFRLISKEWIQLLCATFLLRLTSYADKLVLYPILGGFWVSVYFAATIISKMITIIIMPINSVVLTYLAKVDSKPTGLFWKTFVIGLISCTVFYFFCIWITGPILNILYPQFVDKALDLIWIVTATTMVSVLSVILQPFVLKFCQMKHQITMNILDTIFYFLFSLVFLYFYQLEGFCFGILISKIIKILIQLVIFVKSNKRFEAFE